MASQCQISAAGLFSGWQPLAVSPTVVRSRTGIPDLSSVMSRWIFVRSRQYSPSVAFVVRVQEGIAVVPPAIVVPAWLGFATSRARDSNLSVDKLPSDAEGSGGAVFRLGLPSR